MYNKMHICKTQRKDTDGVFMDRLAVVRLLLIYICFSLLGCVDLEKCTKWELQVKFHWEQNEDYSPEIAEKLFQRVRGRGLYKCDFWWRGSYMQSGTQVLQKVSASLMKVMSC